MREKILEKKHKLEEGGTSGAQREEEERLKEEIRAIKKAREEEEEEKKRKQEESFVEQQRKKYLKTRMSKEERQKVVAERFRDFKKNLQQQALAGPAPAAAGEDEEAGWFQHELRFEEDEWAKTRIDPMLKKPDEDDSYVVFDPLQGKKKEGPSRHQMRINPAMKKLEKW